MAREFLGWEVGDRVLPTHGPWEACLATITEIDEMTGVITFAPDDPTMSTGPTTAKAWQLESAAE